MDYVYAIMWLLVAIILVVKFSKESKIFYLLGSFFLLMAIWWFANAMTPDIDLLSGNYGLILRGIGAVVLLITGVFYYKNIYLKGKK